jgi:hypothetical protein
VGEGVSRRTVLFARGAGLLVAVGAVSAATFVTSKLYTGRAADTPIRAAMYEQPLLALVGLVGLALGLWIAARPREFVAARAWLNPRWVWRERRGEAVLLAISLALCLLLLEAGSRALYARDQRLPFFFPPDYLVYPPLYHAMRDYSPDATNVLLLGGSVLNGVGKGNRLQDALGPDWRVYTVAQNAHSSLDSLTKYRWLLDHGYRFDYVVFYHGINEVRANNAPPDVFRADYSHYLFYRLVHAVFDDAHPVRRALLHSALYFRVDRLVTQLRETRALGRRFVNIAYPREDWLQYGADIRSAASFEANLLAIADLAQTHSAHLLVGEFAYDPRLDDYVAEDPSTPPRDEMIAYTREWGLPEHVRNGVAAHNQIAHDHAGPYTWFSLTALKRPEVFIDPCHFTDPGEQQFIDLLADTLHAQ